MGRYDKSSHFKKHDKCAKCSIKEAREKARGKNHYRANPVVQCDLENNFIKIWDCAADVERTLGILHSNLSNCCRGEKGAQTAGGYKWYYLYDKTDNDRTIFGAMSLNIVSEVEVKKYINSNIGDDNAIQVN